MPTTVTFTIPDADVPRVQAAIAATGQTPKALLVAYLQSVVYSFESQAHAQQFLTGYKPVGVS